MSRFILVVFALLCFHNTQAQNNVVRDSSLFDPHVSMSYAYQIPGGDMASRFGNNNNIGLGFHIKSRTNWYYGVQGTFLFGQRVIPEEGFLQNLKVSGNYILDNDGQPAKFAIQERGFTITGDIGRVFNFIGPNKNSGLLVMVGGGLLQHKIRIEHQEVHIQQLEGDYLKGYDRLTNGPVINEFVGYYYMGNNHLLNFYIGVEAWQGFTKCRRDFNFDTQKSDTQNRHDNLVGLRCGWTLHLYRRMADNYYYY